MFQAWRFFRKTLFSGNYFGFGLGFIKLSMECCSHILNFSSGKCSVGTSLVTRYFKTRWIYTGQKELSSYILSQHGATM